jgi:hypothetical protein
MDWCCMLCGMTMIHAAIHFPWEAVNRLSESLQDLSHNRTIDTGSSSWVTACQYMPTYRCLAVTTFSRSLTMYDITSPFCTICGSVPKMDYTPMTMDIWPDRGSMKECEMVIIGDAGGMIHLHRIQPNQKQDSLQVCFGDSASVCLCMCVVACASVCLCELILIDKVNRCISGKYICHIQVLLSSNASEQTEPVFEYVCTAVYC